MFLTRQCTGVVVAHEVQAFLKHQITTHEVLLPAALLCVSQLREGPGNSNGRRGIIEVVPTRATRTATHEHLHSRHNV